MILIIMDDSHFCKIFLNERIAEGKAFDPNDFTVRKQLAACLPFQQAAAFYVTIKSDQMDGGQLTGQTITRAVSISQITRRAFDVSRVTHLLDKLHTQVVHQGGIAKAFVCVQTRRASTLKFVSFMVSPFEIDYSSLQFNSRLTHLLVKLHTYSRISAVIADGHHSSSHSLWA